MCIDLYIVRNHGILVDDAMSVLKHQFSFEHYSNAASTWMGETFFTIASVAYSVRVAHRAIPRKNPGSNHGDD